MASPTKELENQRVLEEFMSASYIEQNVRALSEEYEQQLSPKDLDERLLLDS